jgi:hypothetical protein
MKQRTPKETDKNEIDKAISILSDCIELNPQIEPTIWISAFVEAIVRTYAVNRFSYNQFALELEKIKNHYKPWFDK